jgi:dihydrofolate synthase/folylpolyglutamate synthase
MNYEEALHYIHSISWTFCKPGLERIDTLCKALGNPQNELKFIHVAGTNGKGSTCSMLESILRTAGYRTGLYVSPFIERFNERMCVNGQPIPDGTLAEITAHVKTFADKMEDAPTEFELITAIGFVFFAKMQCDICVIEAGMGGRLDSTNVFDNPILSVITGIALDHTAFLGDTTEKIAYEKAGILKNGCPVIVGNVDEKALAVIRNKASDLNCQLTKVNYDDITNLRPSLDGSSFDYKNHRQICIPLIGMYQPRNAAAVICAAGVSAAGGTSWTGAGAHPANMLRARSVAPIKARIFFICDPPKYNRIIVIINRFCGPTMDDLLFFCDRNVKRHIRVRICLWSLGRLVLFGCFLFFCGFLDLLNGVQNHAGNRSQPLYK